MTGLAFGASLVLLVFAAWSAFSAVALGWSTDAPGWRGDAARQVASARLTGPQRDAPSLWWTAVELALLGVGSFFAGVSTVADAAWAGVLATLFIAAGLVAGIGVLAMLLRRRGAGAR